MITSRISCPNCGSSKVVKYGRQKNGAQRFKCQNSVCERRIFLMDYERSTHNSDVRQQIIDMALKGVGIRDTSRQLGVSPAQVIEVFEMIASFGRVHQHQAALNPSRLS